MTNNHPLAAIFDMDGVLIDSVTLNWQAYNQVLESSYGIRVPDEALSVYVGRTLPDQIALLSKHYHIDIDTENFTRDTDIIKQQLFANLQPKPGVINLLKSLKAASIPRAVGTSMTLDTTKSRLTTAGLWQYFDAFVTEEDVERHKPHPDVFLRAAEKLHMNAASCVVFEDAPAGVEAAKSGGMQCIAVVTSIVDQRLLAKADRIVNTLTQVDIPSLRLLITA